MNIFVMNQGPGPVTVEDASGLRHDLGEGSSNVFRAPLRIIPSGALGDSDAALGGAGFGQQAEEYVEHEGAEL